MYTDYDYDYTECEGAHSGCRGCGECVEKVCHTTYHTVRKAHHGLFVGDKYARTTGFEYQKGGKRLGYLRPRIQRVGFGPQHPDVLVGIGFTAPPFAVPAVAQERDALVARYTEVCKRVYKWHPTFEEALSFVKDARDVVAEVEAFVAAHDANNMLKLRTLMGAGDASQMINRAEHQLVEARKAAEIQARVDEWRACGGAHKPAGERITYQGREYILGRIRAKWVAHSNMEYMGESVDGEVIDVRSLFCPETGAVLLRWDERWALPY